MQISDFKITEMIGRGTYGKVYGALYHGHEVAIKIQPRVRAATLKRESELMRGLDHENVVKYFGELEEKGQVCVVLELCQRGSLYHVLQDQVMHVGWDRFFSFSKDLFSGLAFLHGHKPHSILHRDIKSLNLVRHTNFVSLLCCRFLSLTPFPKLITQDYRARLCDFGQSTEQRVENLRTMHKMRGTPAWSPPEMIESKTFTIAGDIYAAGVTMWEILYKTMTNRYQRPMSEYAELMLDVQIMVAAGKGKRPSIPENTPEGVKELIELCWSGVGTERPTAVETVAKLNSLRTDYEGSVTRWDSCRKALD
jgi:serine/threonine protein kinase